jgi:fructose-1,6-bisphosphatase II
MADSESLDRNLAFELARVTEAAALAAARWMGRGDKIGADQAAVNAMRVTLGSVDMDGVVVIGEGEKDEAPMLYVGEEIGNGLPPRVDIAVDPVDGTTLLSKGMPNSVSVVALAERGTMFSTPVFYMEKIAVGPLGKGKISLEYSVADNIKSLARAKGVEARDLTIVILDRPRHTDLVEEVRRTEARIKFISDGDVAGGIMPCMDNTGVDMLLGIGGSPEAVVTACALKCLGGEIQCKLWPRDEAEREKAKAMKQPLGKVLTMNDLVRGDDVFMSLTGITHGELVDGVRYTTNGALTETLAMRSRSGTIRRVLSRHNIEKLSRYAAVAYE